MTGRKWKQCADRKEFPIAERAGKRKYTTFDTAWYQCLPQAIPCVDLAIIQVVLFTGVENKLSFMGSVFLWIHKMRHKVTSVKDTAERCWIRNSVYVWWQRSVENVKEMLCACYWHAPQCVLARLSHNKASVIYWRKSKLKLRIRGWLIWEHCTDILPNILYV